MSQIERRCTIQDHHVDLHFIDIEFFIHHEDLHAPTSAV